MSRGVPAGANSAIHPATLKSGIPCSMIVGTFGKVDTRVGVVTAMARMAPASTWALAVVVGTSAACNSPPIKAVNNGASPPNGTIWISVPVAALIISIVR